jgi:hypothetical protein
MDKSLAPIIFVWIGEFLPHWFDISMSLAAQNNINRKIILLINYPHQSLNSIASLGSNVEIFNLNIDKSFGIKSNKLLDNTEFWVNTSLRFWYLREFSKLHKCTHFFHAELDNAIFPLGNLDKTLNDIGRGLFVPRDAADRGIASLIYCNETECLDKLIDIYTGHSHPKHDMDALGIFATKFPEIFYSLPTESFQYNKKMWDLIDPMIVKGIFDAASIGQYLLGVDPKCLAYKTSWNGFINENCKINWNHVSISSDGKRFFLKYDGNFKDYNFPLYNLHVHSKNWQAFESALQNGSLIKRLQRGKTSIVSGREHLLFSYFIIFVGYLRNNLKKLVMKFIGKYIKHGKNRNAENP